MKTVLFTCPEHGNFACACTSVTALADRDKFFALAHCPKGCCVNEEVDVDQFIDLREHGAAPSEAELANFLLQWHTRPPDNKPRRRLWPFGPALVGVMLAFSNNLIGVGVGLALVCLTSALVWRDEK